MVSILQIILDPLSISLPTQLHVFSLTFKITPLKKASQRSKIHTRAHTHTKTTTKNKQKKYR